MATNHPADWRELFDGALFEPNRVKLRQRIEHARNAINSRLDALTKDPGDSGKNASERIALRDALTTLAELHKIAYTRKASASLGREGGRAAG